MANIVEIILRTTGTRQTKQALGSVTSEMGSMRKMVGSLGLALGAYGLTRTFIKFTAESIKTAARVQEMALVVGMLGERAGYTNEQIDASIESITELGIRTDVAQQLVSQFLRYELDLADAVDLARIAQDAAVLSMQDSSDALNQMIYGITTFNVRVLRTAGLNVQMGNAFDDLADSMGKAAEDLTNTERIQAALNAVQTEGIRIAGAYETAMEAPGKQLRSMERHVFELKSTLGEQFLPAMGDAVEVTTEWLKILKAAAEEGWLHELIGDAGEFAAAMARGLVSWTVILGEYIPAIKAYSDEQSRAEGAQALLNATTEEANRIALLYGRGGQKALRDGLILLTDSYEEYKEAIDKVSGPSKRLITDLYITEQGYRALTLEITGAAEAMKNLEKAMVAPDPALAFPRRRETYEPRDIWGITDEAVEIFVNFQTNLAEVMQEQQGALDTLRNEWLADEIRERESYQADLAAAAEDFYSDQAEALEDFHQRESEIEADYYRDRMRFAEDHSLEMAQLEEDHQTRLRHLRENYDYSQEDAIANRDAIAFVRNQRRYERDRQRLEEGHQTETQRRDADFARRMADMEADFQEERTARLAHLEQRQAEAAAAYQEEQADLAAAHAERIADLEEQYVLEEGLLRAKHKKEEKTLKDKFKKELLAYADQAGELEGILGEWHTREKEMVGAQLESHMGAFEDWLLAIGEGIDGLPVGGDGGGVDGPSGGPDTWPPGRYIGEMREWNGYVYLWNGSYWSRGTAVPGYQSGAWEIQQDQIAQLHAGEMVVPKAPADAMRNNLALLAATPRGGTTSVSMTQTNSFPGLDGATAAEVAALVRPQTIELLQQYARGY